MTRLTVLTAFFLFLSKLLSAQPVDGNISGSALDGGDQKNIDAATISLFKAKDSSLVKISLADKAGKYVFEHIPDGKYYLSATSTGHASTFSKPVIISGNNSVIVPPLHLATTVKTLSTVNVTAMIKKPFIERKIDRTIINVDAAITNAGTTAMEVLEKSPGITVDKDGNISLKGKQGVTIMMDGLLILAGRNLQIF
jgi:iron complex outermembrane receptor protein